VGEPLKRNVGLLLINVSQAASSQVVTHVRILAALYLVFGLSSILMLTIIIGMFLLFILSPMPNGGEDHTSAELLGIAIVLIPFLVVAPLAAVYGLLRNRRWMRIPIAISATFTLPVSLGLAFVSLWELRLYSMLIFIVPSFVMFVYSVWFLWRRAGQQALGADSPVSGLYS